MLLNSVHLSFSQGATTLLFSVDFNQTFYFWGILPHVSEWNAELCRKDQTKSASRLLCSVVVPSDELDLEPKLKHSNQGDIWAVQSSAEMWRTRKSHNKVNCRGKISPPALLNVK